MSEWREIPGYAGYEVSDTGDVLSYWKKDSGSDTMSQFLSKQGYAYVVLRGNKHLAVHRLVALAFLGVSVDGMDVHHKNGNKLDNRPENLEVMTRADHITTRKPAAQWKRKDKRFSEKDVIDIRARRKSGVSQTILALEYGVSQCAISKIASGETYQDIGGPRVSGRTCKRGRSRDGNTTHIR